MRQPRGAARGRSWMLAASVVLAVSSAVAPSAAAPTADEQVTFGTGVLIYEGTLERDSFTNEGGTQETRSDPVTITLSCVDGACTFTAAPRWLQFDSNLPILAGEVVTLWSEPAFGTPCAEEGEPDYYRNSTEGTATASVTGLAAEAREEPSELVSCSPTVSRLRWGSNLTLVAELTSGNPCVLDETLCPEPEPEPVVLAAPLDAPVVPSTPSTLSELAAPSDTLALQQVLTAVLLTLVLVILLALPTALLNSASSTGAEKVAAWRASVAARRAALGSGLPTGLRATGEKVRAWWARTSARGRGLPLAAATLLAAAVMSGFVDPDFGTGASTPRVLLSIVLGFTLEVLLGWVAMLILLPRLIAGVDARLDVRPATLLIVLGAVIVTRLTGFEPGIVFGLVAGVAVGATLATAARVRVALAGLAWGYALALLAWVTYAALEPAVIDAASTSPDGLPPLGLVLLREALATMTMAGIAALPVALVPLRGLTGHEVWTWSKPLWASLYAVGLLSFFLVLMPMPFAWAGVEAALATWVTGYLLYAGVAVALWLAITQPWKRDAEPRPPATAAAETTTTR
ncbi:hypothetical protein [Microcella sp.]|uniref:hypothetical protein n=1 Tax=Microcella sp. TaxID=1913979 RepID=UPI00256B4520|nr:hypothetical protein [Microcella sp.]MBX9471001.1 hypothetical protein [Microcella sp.]